MMFKLVLLFLIGVQLSHTEDVGLNVIVEDDGMTKETDSANILSADELCGKLKCEQGEQCEFIDNVPTCTCVEQCEVPEDERLKICTTFNQTFDSECHFYREKCWCKKQDNKCTEPSIIKDKLDYFGGCQFINGCTKEQKEVFPSRIKIWLDEVLNILNDRHDLDAKKYGPLVSLAHKMKKDKVEKYWTCGVVFEFCQLDKSHDGVIQVEEMRALIAPIKALENCIQPFLEECDANNDSKISDVEWAKCLDLSDDDLKLLRSVCKP